MRTIDMTPTWTETANMLVAIMQNGDAAGKVWAYSEVRRMGEIIDRLNK
ncbi:hypothetical protein SAMN05216227_102027 [Pseudorhodobacter antarcticus]|uniref:Uncharacterized protein n=1 Tax=Pseudorhodobacter antarcticus TaxID=1077947 RepID=A0A1H8IGG3_9RHOB|nr:hypothetical protein SAMN05216227_102027 [Pseudorhodobacter antarcticus]